jgi:hypothetical protein
MIPPADGGVDRTPDLLPPAALPSGTGAERAVGLWSRMGGDGLARDGAGTPEAVLGMPTQGQHVAQLYTEPAVLARAVARFATPGLRSGEAVLLVATAGHRPAILRCLRAVGYGPAALARAGQLVVLDAVETLGAILLADGEPDRARFQAVIGGAVDLAAAAGYPRVRAFGEMVNILRQASFNAALQLEALWSELIAARRIALLCGYSIDAFDPPAYKGVLQRVTATHSHLVPVEDYTLLARAVALAFGEVFGAGYDAGLLRRLFVAQYPRPAGMPDAQAAILAVQEFVPEATAALLDRIRHHYRGAATN